MAELPQEGPPRRPLADRLELGSILIVATAVVGLSYWRLYYGVDFTDESFYIAVP